MSRFLGSYRRLARKLRRLETENGGSGLGMAMIEHARTGKLPSAPGARAQLIWFLDTVEAMAQTMPGPGPSGNTQKGSGGG
jgi:hypothetical protein